MMTRSTFNLHSFAAMVIAILLAQTYAHAQTSGRQAWFVAASIPGDIENPILVKTSNDLTQVTLTTRAASSPVSIPSDGLVEVVREIENPDRPGEIAYHTLARAAIPEDVRHAMVMLIPIRKESEYSLRFEVKVQDLAEFRGGGFMYLNLTNLNVAVQLGDERMAMRPGQSRIANASNLETPVNKPISYHYFHPENEEWQLISASTVALVPSRREICVFTWDSRYNRIRYHGISFPVGRR